MSAPDALQHTPETLDRSIALRDAIVSAWLVICGGQTNMVGTHILADAVACAVAKCIDIMEPPNDQRRIVTTATLERITVILEEATAVYERGGASQH